MKVLHLTKFYPPVRGGIETVSYEFAEGLNRRGIHTDVLCANTQRNSIRESTPSGYAVTRASSFGKLLSTSMAPAMIPALWRDRKGYDLVHVHLPDPMANLALWLVRPRGKLVLQWHSDIVNQSRALKFYAPLQQWLLRRADAIVATSAAYAETSPWLRPYGAKVCVIPLGIRQPPAPGSGLAEMKDRYRGRRLVFSLGRMTYYKGFDVLIEAAALLPSDALVVVGGGGELLESHRATARATGVADRIRFVGPMSDDDVASHLHGCNVFCLPSITRAEAFGVVLLEAMAAGRPIVATRIHGSGVPWVSLDGVTGFNIEPQDPQALAQALTTILDNRDLAAGFGDAARARYLENFTVDRMIDSMVDLYKRAAPDHFGLMRGAAAGND